MVQYDWCSWIPNAPSTMRQPPPDKKGVADVKLILETLPDRGRSSWHLGAVWALSQYQDNEVLKGGGGAREHRYIFCTRLTLDEKLSFIIHIENLVEKKVIFRFLF